MNYKTIDKKIKIHQTTQKFADELFYLTEKNREFLKQWLPWLDNIKSVEDTKEFIESQIKKHEKKEALHLSIFYKEKLVGVLGFNSIKKQVGVVGYWLDEEYNNLGIMTKCVEDLIFLGFNDLDLKKIEIRCASKNIKSQAIPKKLGFKKENIIKDAENLYGKYVDHIVFSLTKN